MALRTKKTSRTRKASRAKKTSQTKTASRAKRTLRTKRGTALPAGPVSIKYKIDNSSKFFIKNCDLLVVACDPRNLYGRCDYRPAEKAVFQRLFNFTFHTTLMKVKRDPQAQLPSGVVFAPEPMDRMDGSIYAFRNETAKQFGLKRASAMRENWVTVYQLQKKVPKPWSPNKFQHVLIEELKTLEWWPYGRTARTDYQITDCVTTPYFDQFSGADLQNGWPWKFLRLQGKHNTIYVHASTCFESTLQCWSYANMLLDPTNKLGVTLPANRKAPIAILGAGASGILFANRLRDLRYTNVEILEVTGRSDGKVHTIVKNGPYPPNSSEPTVCELGACYLSPAYGESYIPADKNFVNYLKPFLKNGNQRLPLARYPEDANRFRAIWTEGQFPRWRNTYSRFMPYDRYVIEKAKHDLGFPEEYKDDDYIEAKIGEALVLYVTIHEGFMELYMGNTGPMPLTQPPLFSQLGSISFEQFLSGNDMIALVGLLQYGYSVQGYGSLKSAPAYYGMIWINPAVIEAIVRNDFGGDDPIVTLWSKGWGNVFDQMKAGMRITCNARTIKIKRKD